MDEQTFLTRLYEERAVAIIRTDTQEKAASAMDAAVRGGFRVIEFTLGCPGAYELVEDFLARDPDLVVGVGTVLTAEGARRAVEAGACTVPIGRVLSCRSSSLRRRSDPNTHERSLVRYRSCGWCRPVV